MDRLLLLPAHRTTDRGDDVTGAGPTFLLTSLVVVLLPGAGTLYTLAASLGRGSRAGVLAAFACTLGIVPHLLAAITGLAALLQASGMVFAVVKYAGVAYLLYLALGTWRDTGTLRLESASSPYGVARVLRNGITVNLLNPKLTVFFFAFLPQFVDVSRGGVAFQILVLGLVFMGLAVISDGAYAVAAGSAAGWVSARRGFARAERFVSGGVLVGLGLATAFSGAHRKG